VEVLEVSLEKFDCYCSTNYDVEAGGRHRCPEANTEIAALTEELRMTSAALSWFTERCRVRRDGLRILVTPTHGRAEEWGCEFPAHLADLL
jgi:hypothetical protein